MYDLANLKLINAERVFHVTMTSYLHLQSSFRKKNSLHNMSTQGDEENISNDICAWSGNKKKRHRDKKRICSCS